MSWTKAAVSTLFIMSMLAGCPLEDDLKLDGGNAGNTGNGETDSGKSPAPQDIDASDDAVDDASTDADAAAAELDGGEVAMDAAVTPDAGDMQDGGTPVDAGEDSGTPIVAPDLGAAELADADRATLINNLLKAESFRENWYPYFQSSTDRRPLLVKAGSHGTSVRAFQNAVAKQAADAWVAGGMAGPLVMPNGSIIAKDSYKEVPVDGGTPDYVMTGTLVMAKVAVLDGATYEGKWFYMKVSTADEAARSTTCVNCHNGRSQKTLWPILNPSDPLDVGGQVDAIVPYDYLYLPYCIDPKNTLCDGPT